MAKGFKTGGRTKDSAKVDASLERLKKLARRHGPAIITELASLAKTAPEKAVRVSAIKELLDRGFGKATQVSEHKVDADIKVTISGDDRNL